MDPSNTTRKTQVKMVLPLIRLLDRTCNASSRVDDMTVVRRYSFDQR